MAGGWRDRRLINRLGLRGPLFLAPMAGAGGPALAIAAARGGALPALPCALLSPDQLRRQVAEVRAAVGGPIHVNFFAHSPADEVDDSAWRAALQPFYDEYGVGPPAVPPPLRRPFDAAMAEVVEELRPDVVSFHFGLPAPALIDRVRGTGALILASASTPAEGRWLAERGVDGVIAQGWEAGGHSTRFLPAPDSARMTVMALIPQLADVTGLPIVAAGGIGDERGIAAAAMLGAAAVQIGTAYLACPESLVSELHRARLAGPEANETVMTNLFTGRPARGFPTRLTQMLGPISDVVPPFPHAGDALAELRQADPAGFANMWAGQAAALSRAEPAEPAEALTVRWLREAAALLGG